MCLLGASRVAVALSGVPPHALVRFIVWVPMLPPDTAESAETASAAFPESSQFWDAERTLARRIGRTLRITSPESIGAPGRHGLAWDVYLAYARGRSLGGAPDFWMHQLAVARAPRLDSDEFRRRVERLLTP